MGRALKMCQVSGDPYEIVRLIEVEKPKPGPGEVLVHIILRTVNPSDLLCIRLGHLPVCKFSGAAYNPGLGTENGIIPGTEGFGLVEEVGEGVTRFSVGQRVVPCIYAKWLSTGTQGAWQDYVVVEEEEVYAISDSISDETAAQLVANPWTAYVLLKTIAAPKGEYIISSAAGSVVGRLIIQLAKHWGVKTINIVRHDKYTEELKALGADVVINSSKEDVVAKVLELTNGKGAYGALDAVAGELTKTIASAVRDEGEIWVYGVLSGYDITVGAFDLARLLKVRWWILNRHTATVDLRKEVGREVIRLFDEKVWAPLSFGKKFKLEEFTLAFAEAETFSKGGKVLLTS
ncbi:hypothetical protein Mapa_017371 [Marchantia paleacea]|nr:hypothetical protein Mapa_017371 [Marchantia paleacea]